MFYLFVYNILGQMILKNMAIWYNEGIKFNTILTHYNSANSYILFIVDRVELCLVNIWTWKFLKIQTAQFHVMCAGKTPLRLAIVSIKVAIPNLSKCLWCLPYFRGQRHSAVQIIFRMKRKAHGIINSQWLQINIARKRKEED